MRRHSAYIYTYMTNKLTSPCLLQCYPSDPHLPSLSPHSSPQLFSIFTVISPPFIVLSKSDRCIKVEGGKNSLLSL